MPIPLLQAASAGISAAKKYLPKAQGSATSKYKTATKKKTLAETGIPLSQESSNLQSGAGTVASRDTGVLRGAQVSSSPYYRQTQTPVPVQTTQPPVSPGTRISLMPPKATTTGLVSQNPSVTAPNNVATSPNTGRGYEQAESYVKSENPSGAPRKDMPSVGSVQEVQTGLVSQDPSRAGFNPKNYSSDKIKYAQRHDLTQKDIDSPDFDTNTRKFAVKALIEQGITDKNTLLDMLNKKESGELVGDFTMDELDKYMQPGVLDRFTSGRGVQTGLVSQGQTDGEIPRKQGMSYIDSARDRSKQDMQDRLAGAVITSGNDYGLGTKTTSGEETRMTETSVDGETRRVESDTMTESERIRSEMKSKYTSDIQAQIDARTAESDMEQKKLDTDYAAAQRDLEKQEADAIKRKLSGMVFETDESGELTASAKALKERLTSDITDTFLIKKNQLEDTYNQNKFNINKLLSGDTQGLQQQLTTFEMQQMSESAKRAEAKEKYALDNKDLVAMEQLDDLYMQSGMDAEKAFGMANAEFDGNLEKVQAWMDSKGLGETYRKAAYDFQKNVQGLSDDEIQFRDKTQQMKYLTQDMLSPEKIAGMSPLEQSMKIYDGMSTLAELDGSGLVQEAFLRNIMDNPELSDNAKNTAKTLLKEQILASTPEEEWETKEVGGNLYRVNKTNGETKLLIEDPSPEEKGEVLGFDENMSFYERVDRKMKIYEDTNRQFEGFKRLSEEAGKGNPAAQMGLIFSFMKVLDPTSVVRESEYAAAAGLTSLWNSIQNKYNKMQAGETIGQDQVDDFTKTIEVIMEGIQDEGRSVLARERATAVRFGLDESVAIPNTFGDMKPLTTKEFLASDNRLNEEYAAMSPEDQQAFDIYLRSTGVLSSKGSIEGTQTGSRELAPGVFEFGEPTKRTNGRQCAGFVNDALGLHGTTEHLGDKLADKIDGKNFVSIANGGRPRPGGYFVMDLGTEWGHAGAINAVNPDRSIQVTHYNLDTPYERASETIRPGSERWNQIVGFGYK